MRKTFLVAGVLAVFSAGVSAGTVTGTWSWTGPNDSGRWLRTIQSKNTVRFQLELARGGPSYNTGFIEGEFELRGNKGTFRSPEYSGCEIGFVFEEKRAVLSDDSGNFTCGFGNAVSADGEYPLQSREIPSFTEGDPRTQ